MTSKGPFGRTLLRGLRLTGRRAPTHIKEDAFQAEPPRRKEGLRRREAGACNCPKEKRQVNVFKIKKAEKRTVNRVAPEVNQHVQVFYRRYQKDAGKGKGRKENAF